MSPDPGKRAVWIAVIGALGVIIAAIIANPIFLARKNPIVFTGMLEEKLGNHDPIAFAKILISVDGDAPQLKQSDSNGEFHIQIPEKTNSLDLTISAAGFKTLTLAPNPHQFGVLPIGLESSTQPELPQPPITGPVGPPTITKPRERVAVAPPTKHIAGTWEGTFPKSGLPLVFNFDPQGSGTVYSPSQGFHSAATAKLSDNTLTISVPEVQGTFTGTENLKGGKTTGVWSQGSGYSDVLTLVKQPPN